LKDVVIFNDLNPENLGIGQQIFTALAEMLRSVSWSSMVSWPGSIAASKSVCRRLVTSVVATSTVDVPAVHLVAGGVVVATG